MFRGTQRHKEKRAISRLISAGAAALLVSGSMDSSAWALDITTVCSLEPQVAKLKTVNLEPKCSTYLSNPATQPLAESCQTCSTAIRTAQGAVDASYATACGQSAGADAAGTAAAKAAGEADPNAQAGFLTGTEGMATKAAEAVGIKQSSALEFGKAAEACAAKVKTACQASAAPDAVAAGDAVAASCSEMAASSYALGGAAGGGASTLGDMAKYALGGAALLGLGAMAYSMLKGKGGSNNGSYDPYQYGQYGKSGLNGTSPTPESLNTSSTVTNITDKTQPGGTSLGSTKNTAGTGASGSLALGSGGSNSKSGDASTTAEKTGAGASARSGRGFSFSADLGSGPVEMPGTYRPTGSDGAAGGGAGAGTLGASSAGDFAAQGGGSGVNTGADGAYYDMGAVGGKTGAILGMKSNGDIKDLEGALGTPEGGFNANNEGERALASEGMGAQAQKGEGGDSLFHMIRARYAELKKKGHI